LLAFEGALGCPPISLPPTTTTTTTTAPTTEIDWCNGEFKIQSNNLLGVIPEWGPTWKISFDINVQSFDNDGADYGNIFRFTSTDNDCCNIGDRIPALFTRNENVVSPSIETGKWYSFEIKQHFSDDQWINEITAKDDMDEEIFYHFFILTSNIDAFTNVSVFAGDQFYNPSDAKIKCFHFSSGTYSYSF